MNPLLHYWQYGEKENRNPIGFFDTEWYKENYRDDIGKGSALGHFLRNRSSLRVTPNRFFDASYYLQNNKDVEVANIDPLEHFLSTGHREGRSPSLEFDVVFYTRSFMHDDTRDPLTHYLEVGRAAGYPTQPSEGRPTQAAEIRKFTSKGGDFEDPLPPLSKRVQGRGHVIAFHLPQFHAFPENDLWWGKGFTEWTNVARGTPRFHGHYQPRIPRDLGFYDLTSAGVLKRQVELARGAGLGGFCFYYYNFNGKRLLERPVNAFLEDETLDFSFCLMWANENWTRRWDGAESEVLIRQDYRREDADALVDDLARHFVDRRYIRVQGRPLLIVYRPDVIPDPAHTLEFWRARFAELHDEQPLFLMAQGFGNIDPREFGFDGAIEFPPHKVAANLRPSNARQRFFDPSFTAPVFEFDDVVNASLTESPPPYPLIKSVFPGWDNDARRQGHGMVITGSTPKKYQRWLDESLRFAAKAPFLGERFVFINAWNEWAEGAYLEPDLHFGSAYLNATARAIAGVMRSGEQRKILLVGHDAHRHGAQLLLLNIAAVLKRRFGFDVRLLLCEGGELVPEYQQVATAVVCVDENSVAKEVSRLAADGIRTAITNTVATGGVVPTLKSAGFTTVSLIHELPRIIREKSLQRYAKQISTESNLVVFPATQVESAFRQEVGPIAGESIVKPQGLYHEVDFVPDAATRVRDELGLRRDTPIVINIGYADLRKGVDLFCRVADLVSVKHPEVRFVWVGNVDQTISTWFRDDAARKNVVFLGQRDDIGDLLSAANVFALTSREDPFPSVVLEALSVGLRVVAFDDAGGFVDLLRNKSTGQLVPFCNVDAMADEIVACLKRRDGKDRLPPAIVKNLRDNFAFDNYAFWLASQLDASLRKVSVIIPNFNYAQYLPDRLATIFGQSHPVFETVVLDDASPDDSVAVIERAAELAERDIKLIVNKENTGNPFAQWKKGLSHARGELVWIAEADDLADRRFLERLLRFFDDDSMLFAFSDSVPIDSDGRPLAENYKDYYARLFPGALSTDLIDDSREFAKTFLSQRNVILNASGVVWRRSALEQALDKVSSELTSYRLAGDWLLYLAACGLDGRIGYCSTPLNRHRRHSRGVTSRTAAEGQLSEISRIHAFANRILGSTEGTTASQRRYIEELERQFGT